MVIKIKTKGKKKEERRIVKMLENAGVDINMTPKDDAEALDESAKKWEAIADLLGDIEDVVFDTSCPLCALHRDEVDARANCDECPVGMESGDSDCRGTPWKAAREAIGEAAMRAYDEAEHLKSLRENY